MDENQENKIIFTKQGAWLGFFAYIVLIMIMMIIFIF